MCEAKATHRTNDEGPTLENLRTENPDATEPAASRACTVSTVSRAPAETPKQKSSVPPGALALGPAAAAEGEFQHAAPRLPP